MSKRRVVITGIGLLTPVGNTAPETWEALLAGKSGVTVLEQYKDSELACKIGAQIKNFNADLALTPKEQKRLDTFVHFACVAAKEAMDDAGLTVDDELAPRAGTAIGSGIGGMPSIEENHTRCMEGGPRRISPFFIPGSIINQAAGYPSIQHNLKGPNFSVVTACTTGVHNIGLAMRAIQYGDADVMLAGGCEMATSVMGIGGFAIIKALSLRNDEPERASRPFDAERDGFVLGEGAGIVVLEELEHAKKRGAKIYAELSGFGYTGDAFHVTLPDESADGATRTMQMAIKDAGLKPEDIDYINAHGTSTKANDKTETKGIKQALGDHAYKVAISSTKSMTGHLLGAAGSVETAIAALAIKHNIAPPTINLENPDPDCDLDYIPNKAREMPIKHAMSNSFGFGGTNGAVVLSKYED